MLYDGDAGIYVDLPDVDPNLIDPNDAVVQGNITNTCLTVGYMYGI